MNKSENLIFQLESGGQADKIQALDKILELTKKKRKKFIPYFLLFLNESSATLRQKAIVALEKSGKLDYKTLLKLLKFNNDEVKKYAIWELASAKTKQAMPELENVLFSDISDDVSLYLLWALMVLGTNTKVLLKVCREKDTKTKELAVWIIKENRLKTLDVIKTLISMANNGNIDSKFPLTVLLAICEEEISDLLLLLDVEQEEFKKYVFFKLEQKAVVSDFSILAPKVIERLETPDKKWHSYLWRIVEKIVDNSATQKKSPYMIKLIRLQSLREFPQKSHLKYETNRIKQLLFKEMEKGHLDNILDDDAIARFIEQNISIGPPQEIIEKDFSPQKSQFLIQSPPETSVPEPLLVKCKERELKTWEENEYQKNYKKEQQLYEREQKKWEKEKLRYEREQKKWEQEQKKWEQKQQGHEPCVNCDGLIEFTTKGNYQCPRCRSYIHINDYGFQCRKKVQRLELKLPSSLDFIVSIQEMLHCFMVEEVEFDEKSCQEIEDAIEIAVKILVEKRTCEQEMFQVLAAIDSHSIVIGVKILNQFVVPGEVKNVWLGSIAQKLDCLEVYPLPKGGQILKMTKKRKIASKAQ